VEIGNVMENVEMVLKLVPVTDLAVIVNYLASL
jgi:hypothetical protein